jgi:hemoglobin
MEPKPTLFDHLGGQEALDRLTAAFYLAVRSDFLLAPVFSAMPQDHPHHVALFLGEVMGGPAQYTELRGDEAHRYMMSRHWGRHLTEEQRIRWVELLLQTFDELDLPHDDQFRRSFRAYLEWGTKIAVGVSNQEHPIGDPGPMPLWDWDGIKRN